MQCLSSRNLLSVQTARAYRPGMYVQYVCTACACMHSAYVSMCGQHTWCLLVCIYILICVSLHLRLFVWIYASLRMYGCTTLVLLCRYLRKQYCHRFFQSLLLSLPFQSLTPVHPCKNVSTSLPLRLPLLISTSLSLYIFILQPL